MTPEELLAQLSQPGPGEAYLATQGAGAGTGMFGFDPVSAVLSSALNYTFGIPSRNEAERAKNRAIEQATINAMTAEGKNPYQTYNVGMFDTSQYADLAGIPTIGTPEEMLRQTVSTVVDAYRKENPEKVEEEFEKIITGQPSVTEEVVSVKTDTDLTPQQTFEGLEEEQKIGRINDALEKNPNATLANILDILTTWNIPTDLFRKATGTTPEEYVGKGDAGAGDDTGNGDGDDTGDGTGDGDGDGDGEGDGGGNGNGDGGNGGGVDKGTPTPTPTPTPDLNEPVKQETILPQLPLTQEPESTTGMLFAALSPDRTTSEVLAPDLFKLDKNIPLVGRLTQNTPMAAPQYLLSGISQRYRV